MSDYLISLIIPTYNRPHQLKKSINSIIRQSLGWENIELIIVDDASTDKKTKKIILEYQKKYPNNIKPLFLDKNSQTCSKARNIAMDHATSKYIVFSDDDDTYLHDGLETLYNLIKKYNSDLVICNHYNNINGDKKPVIKKIKNNIINTQPLKNQKEFNQLSTINGGVCVAKIYNKKFLEKNNIKFIEDIKYEDIPFYMNILKHNPKISVFPQKIVYNHNIQNHTLSSTHDIKAFSDMIKSTKKISKYYQKTNININSILSFMISQLLLIFSNLNKKQKKENILKIYKLEKYLENKSHFNTHLERKEADILNQAIIEKNLKKP